MTATTLVETPGQGRSGSAMLFRILAVSIVAASFAFLLNNYLTFWLDWPGVGALFGGEEGGTTRAAIQGAIYLVLIAMVVAYVSATSTYGLRVDAERLSSLSAFIIRAAFWSVLLIGIVDTVISFLRVEGLLPAVFGQELATDLGLSRFRGAYVHYPLILVSLVIAFFTRSLGFAWLALLVVIAELQIVIARFIFSYEQAFMGDLVRFWYASLFLFASAYTLTQEGHVRVDVVYAGMSKRGKAWANAVGSLILGLPLTWIILIMGMGGRASVINSPLLSFETTQAGFGLYVKYLMAGFLAVFAVSMMIQFMSYFLSSVATLRGEPDEEEEQTDGEPAVAG